MSNKQISYHVVRNPIDGWSVKKSGSHRASGTYDTQKEAISHAKRAAKKYNADVVIHGKDGRIKKGARVSGTKSRPVKFTRLRKSVQIDYKLVEVDDEWTLFRLDNGKVIRRFEEKAEAIDWIDDRARQPRTAAFTIKVLVYSDAVSLDDTFVYSSASPLEVPSSQLTGDLEIVSMSIGGKK